MKNHAHITLRCFISLFIINFLGACTTVAVDPPAVLSENTTSILVVPAINQSTSADAPDYYAATVLEPLANRGYYILPIEITTELLKQEGIQDGDQLTNVNPKKFHTLFGADAVLFVTIHEWNTSYYVIGGGVSVALEFKLVSTSSGQILWQRKDRVVQDTSGDSQHGLIGAIINTAIKTAMQDYIPVAQKANTLIVSKLPPGKYHALDKKKSQP